MIIALNSLHKRKIIYRNLKPENILLGEDGYIRLTDFRSSEVVGSRVPYASSGGTPDYLAPELLDDREHSYPVDWWALGILIFELIVGYPPYYTG